MTDQPKKPKDIKDLKARLGRTIAPGTQKAPISVPGAAPAGVPVPPIAAGGIPAPAPVAGGAPPPAVVPPPAIVAPPIASAVPGMGPGIAPPPFMTPAAPPVAAKEPEKKPADPFASASGASAQQEVRLVIDDKTAVSADEIGRKQSGRSVVVLVIGAVIGIAVGYGGGSINGGRRAYNEAVRDGREIYRIVDEGSAKLTSVQRSLRSAAEKASPQAPGTQPQVDYEAITALGAVTKPFEANAFAGRNYSQFSAAGIEAIFDYYNKANLLWDSMERLRAFTLRSRAELDRDVSGSIAGYGFTPRVADNRHFGVLLVIDPPTAPAPGQPPSNKIHARQPGAPTSLEFEPWQGQSLEEHPENFLIEVDAQMSSGVLRRERATFQEFLEQLAATQGLYEETQQAQGKVMTEIGSIATLEEIVAL